MVHFRGSFRNISDSSGVFYGFRISLPARGVVLAVIFFPLGSAVLNRPVGVARLGGIAKRREENRNQAESAPESAPILMTPFRASRRGESRPLSRSIQVYDFRIVRCSSFFSPRRIVARSVRARCSYFTGYPELAPLSCNRPDNGRPFFARSFDSRVAQWPRVAKITNGINGKCSLSDRSACSRSACRSSVAERRRASQIVAPTSGVPTSGSTPRDRTKLVQRSRPCLAF